MEDVEMAQMEDKQSEERLLATEMNDSQSSIPKRQVNFAVDDVDDNSDLEAQTRHSKGRRRQRRSSRRSTPLEYRKGNKKEPKLVKYVIILVIPALILLSLFFVISQNPAHSKGASPGTAPTGAVFSSGFNIQHNWGSFSPYFDSGAPFKGIDIDEEESDLLARCHYKQVHVLHRHAERFPTTETTVKLKALADKIDNMDSSKPPGKALSWLKNWTYTLSEELLLPSGVGTEFLAGADFWTTHGRRLYNASSNGNLFYESALNTYTNGTKRPIPVLRATTQSRIQTSARAWAAGFFGVYGGHDNSPIDDENLYKLLLVPESEGVNNTLAPYFSCLQEPVGDNKTDSKDNANSTSLEHKIKQSLWIDTYLVDATERLQKLLPGIKDLTPSDVFYMQKMCVYEHAAYGDSGFCELFTETEWRGFEYANDLEFFYDGFSKSTNTRGKAMGAGWVAELTARLENRYITESQGEFGVNTTYTDGGSDTVPMDQLFFLDMSHDFTILMVLNTLGLAFLEKELSATSMPAPRQFIVSRLVPFGARLFVEILGCEDGKEVVRLQLNNRIVPLGGLHYCPTAKDGLCPKDKFIKSLHYALDHIDYDKACFGK